MKKYIAAIVAAVLLAGGCGKFVRDELIVMQNEIDLLYSRVDQLNQSLSGLKDVVEKMENDGYVTSVTSFSDEDGRSGFILTFNKQEIIKLYHGADGKDGADAVSPEITVKQDEEDGRWYWFMGEDWLCTPDGERILVNGQDGKSPTLKIEDGFWYLSWDGGENWEKTEWPAKGDDAYEVFSKIDVFDDRIELTLASDGSVLVLPRYLPVDMELTLEGQDLSGDVLIAPGETLAIKYALTGTGAESALLVAGTDGRFKTALKPLDPEAPSTTEGIVEVTCPATFPVGGYIYITVNDGSGRSQAQVIKFKERSLKLFYGEATCTIPTEGENGRTVSFESNFEVEPVCVFPDGVEAWITVKTEIVENIVALTYDVLPNTDKERSAFIQVCPKDHPGFEMFRITVTQAGVPATGTGEGEGA